MRMTALKYLIKLAKEGEILSLGLKTSESMRVFMDSLFSGDSGG